ncbi:DUF998 domain-containing protein [Herbidospora mongoliensis]|uniref:DUF998 domain-containing protein n=1 Tax=Herbidospora mongoliensis TaxID=688067 RepID=UPI00082E5E7A|nr:DUF998 domain-containing protein [Herbidospora mongoliensis]
MVKRLFPALAVTGLVLAMAAVVAGQLDPTPHLDPVTLSISEYAAQERGMLTEFTLAMLGLASLVLLAGLKAASAPIDGWPERLLLLWSLTLLVVAVVPWTRAQDYLLVVAFIALPAATAQLAGRFTDHEQWRPVARTLEWLTLLAGLGLAAVTYAALPGRGVLIGVAERGLLLVEFALVGAVAWQLVRVGLMTAITTVPGVARQPVVNKVQNATSEAVSPHAHAA